VGFLKHFPREIRPRHKRGLFGAWHRHRAGAAVQRTARRGRLICTASRSRIMRPLTEAALLFFLWRCCYGSLQIASENPVVSYQPSKYVPLDLALCRSSKALAFGDLCAKSL
jgi:hypothetical protein